MSNESIATPQHNPADIQNLGGTTEFIIQKAIQNLEKIAPAEIISYDRTKNRAVVQILNQAITTTGEKITRKPLVDIPVQILHGGGFTLSFPIKPKDKGWICAADRDISIFKSLLKMFAPATYQKHRYKDSFFIPDKVNFFQLDADDKDAVVLIADNGLTKIAVKDNKITLTAKDVLINSTNTKIIGDTEVVGTFKAPEVHSTNDPSGTFDVVVVKDGIVKGGS